MPPTTAPRSDVLSDPATSERVRLRAAASVLPAGAAIARRSAAGVHGFRSGMPHEAGSRPDVEVVLPAGTPALRRPGIRSYSAVTDGDVVVVEGLPVTSALRTALDAARFESPPVALAMLDLGLRQGLFDVPEAHSRLALQPGERGVAGPGGCSTWPTPAPSRPVSRGCGCVARTRGSRR
ncbi:hypothetical protein MO973_38625 [Paenibacillus sp. TRM 82003]|uniref:hypothetical protein n=1 Tax=Kineococcus sp. TRM81007 TaxID=2925831 RepID=UPI001F57517F|nr:hypothetical protein [Kineococcus sp. TRM81007]MCI2239599.1 hypothetical protein [Kineococcus sp. TRM81007]MCI3926119.1 hypothetical protein [Paenibacillus sp. TRM 82003]